MYAAHPARPLLWRAFAINSAVFAAALLLLAATPATVSFPIAVAEGLVLLGGLGVMLGLNLALLQRAIGCASQSPEVGLDAAELAGARAPVDHEAGHRLLVFWTDPFHVSVEEAELWARAEVQAVLAAEGMDAARLTRLQNASARYGGACDWLLELDVVDAPQARAHLDSSAWRYWLSDLRELGLRPTAMVAGNGHLLSPEAE